MILSIRLVMDELTVGVGRTGSTADLLDGHSRRKILIPRDSDFGVMPWC